MCHIAAYASKLGIINEVLLRSAMEVIAQEENVGVSDSVVDYYGKEIRTWKDSPIVSLKTKGLPRGIGVAIIGGKLEFVGDPYGCGTAFNAMQKRIELMYRQVGVVTALKQRGFAVNVHQGESLTLFVGVKP